MINLSEYLDEPEKISRARNLLETQIGSLSFLPNWGVDKQIITGFNGQIMSSSAISYFRQQAFANGIVLNEQEREDGEFMTNIVFKVEE